MDGNEAGILVVHKGDTHLLLVLLGGGRWSLVIGGDNASRSNQQVTFSIYYLLIFFSSLY